MTTEKYKQEVATLKKFFEFYCSKKHQHQNNFTQHLFYNNEDIEVSLCLCDECKELIEYSFDRLTQCPHDPKPRCRTCKAPCYEKSKWKQVAKLMRYSGMHLGLLKVKNIFKLHKSTK